MTNTKGNALLKLAIYFCKADFLKL